MSARNQTQAIPVVCGVIMQRGKILIARRKPTEKLPDCWEFPGGKVEPNETLEEAMVREAKEELDIEVEVQKELHQYEYIDPDHPQRPVLLHFLLCQLKKGEAKPLVATEVKWVKTAEIKAYGFPPGDMQAIAKIISKS